MSVQLPGEVVVHGLLQAGTGAVDVTDRMESASDIARNDDEDLSKLTAENKQAVNLAHLKYCSMVLQ